MSKIDRSKKDFRIVDSVFFYQKNKEDFERQEKELASLIMQAEGKFPRRRRRLKKRPATGNPPRTFLDEQ